MNTRGSILIFLFLFLAFANIIVWQSVAAETKADFVRLVFLDVGQGDAVYIETPSGNQMLIDGGPNRKVLSELGKVMPWFDRTLDVIIATHPDLDHIGGLPAVLDKYKVGIVLEPGAAGNSQEFTLFQSRTNAYNIQTVRARRGMAVMLGDGVLLEILFPDRNVERVDSNTASVVAKLTYGNSSAILTGDAPQSVEEYLVFEDGKILEGDILKIGHHGSKTSTSERFLEAVDPKYAVISAGKNNRYGHPAPEVMHRLRSNNITILDTMDGRVEIRMYGDKEEIR